MLGRCATGAARRSSSPRERGQVAVHLLGAWVQALGGLEQGSCGVEAPQLIKGDAGVVEQLGLAWLPVEQFDRAGGNCRKQAPHARAWGIAAYGKAPLDQAEAGLVAAMGVGDRLELVKQPAVALELAGAQ